MSLAISPINLPSYMLIIMKHRVSLEISLFIIELSIWRSNTTGNISKLNMNSCSSTIYFLKKMTLMNSSSSKTSCCSKNLEIVWWRSQSFFIWSVEKQIDMQKAWSFTNWTFFILCCLLYCLMCLLSLHHSFYA